MFRPRSIINFERCYLGALIVGLVNSMIVIPAMLRTPQVAQASAMFGSGFVYVSTLLGFLITLLLWYLAARRASVVAKWIIVVFFAIGVLGLLSSLATGFRSVSSTSAVLSITGFVLQAVAVYLLFKPDAKAWFATHGANVAEPFQ